MAAYGAHGASDLMKKYSVYFPHKLGDVFKGLRYVRPLVGTIHYNQRLAAHWLTWRYIMLEHCARFNIPWPSLETLLPYAKYAGYAAGAVIGFYLLYILHRKLPLIFYFFRAIWITYLDEGFVAIITHLLVLGRAHCRRVKRAASLR
ncbi:hypothetical protein B0J12DRAFT_666235 [Macrophomina phaseolina]|uniref:Uncharacterized protein n=1 Tax=Macrophomina phaseolina TaxID=35725 RepID=A0ABQ8G960_9PEZI|nr:hypothetical protein B0J12DRAFT_666235 [Macrophomina phaseolina]